MGALQEDGHGAAEGFNIVVRIAEQGPDEGACLRFTAHVGERGFGQAC